MKKLLAFIISLAFLAGINGAALAADPGIADNSTISADKTAKPEVSTKKTTKKGKSKTSKKPKSKKKSKKSKKESTESTTPAGN